MRSLLRPTLVSFFALTLITGGLYPLAVTLIAQGVFPSKANGSLIVQNGQVRGSELIGQPFTEPRYFWGRPSATSPFPYNAGASSGSNLGPTNPALKDAVSKRVETLKSPTGQVPIDLVTASGSGLDPDISPAAALWQVPRIAQARHLPEDHVRALVERNIQPRAMGVWGEPRVNVLLLNLALDRETSGA